VKWGKKNKKRKGNKDKSTRCLVPLKVNTSLKTLIVYIYGMFNTLSFDCMFKNFILALQVQGNSFQKKAALLFGLGHHVVEVNTLLNAGA
jgi:hypothetical protein